VSGLRDRFRSLTLRLGATTDSGALADDLLTAWAAPGRVYHDVRHLEDCLARLDELSLPALTRDRVEAAIWFHDAVYDSRAADNEDRSARWAVESLPALGLDPELAADVARLVHLTRDHAPAADEAGRLLCDIDLSILGRPSAEFDTYEQRVRAEYAWVPEAAYRVGRRRVLSAFLQRDPLFQTEPFRQRFESSARANLQRALAALS
jgi:predicted metal-dependent HD superfamily phosphohydrolase